MIWDIYIFVYNEIKYLVKKWQPLPAKYQRILNKFVGYYKVLPSKDKQRFEQRVHRFILSKKFISRSAGPVTDEMKVLISATAVQMTFGLTEIYLSNFDKILIYPDAYYSHVAQKYHQGEVNPRAGIIILSWRSFVQGYADLTDNVNLGIHEMAHAIHFENRIMNAEYDFLDFDLLDKLKSITHREMQGIRQGGHYLRDYAATNEYEFFAVSLEHFFEQPLSLKEAIPDLYALLVQLLNQDPIRIYKLEGQKITI